MYKTINQCRIGGGELTEILSLGKQAMTGIFPRPEQHVDVAPLDLVWSEKSKLVQLKHSCEPTLMYGNNYGYRSGLNKSMVSHLNKKAKYLQNLVCLKEQDIVLDIGSNDGTLLRSYSSGTKIGMDPTGVKFFEYYPEDILLIAEFFSKDVFFEASNGKQARIISSIAMFYDLEDPISFAKEVYECLAPHGIWHLEQSYLPLMLSQCAYDTICHEHIEYYSLTSIKYILDRAGFQIVDLTINNTNGGSFAITAMKDWHQTEIVNEILKEEKSIGIEQLLNFSKRINIQRTNLCRLLFDLKAAGKTVLGYGASTKGNVILQYCGIDEDLLPFIAEVNSDKFGCFTPGSNIPIISEVEAHAMRPDYFLVMPWHFKENIILREQQYLNNGGKLIFPLPNIEVVG